MNKEHILFLLHFPPPVHGSSMVGKWIRESKTLNMAFRSTYVNLLASKTVAESGRFSIGKLLGFIKVWFQVLGVLLFKKPVVCYFALSTTGAAFYKDVALVFLLKLFRIKIIYHLHNKGVEKASKSRLNRTLYRFAFKNTIVILLSEYLYNDVSAYVPYENIRICANGIPEINVFLKQQKQESTVVQILFLSNLIESKGVFILLEALAILKNNGVPFKSVFVGGEGDISTSLFNETVSLLNLKNEVSYLGKRYGHDKDIVLQQSDIFAFPTFKECFPLVIIEAMQCGLAVVSCPEGGIPDIVEDGVTGYLVSQKNILALADRLKELIENPNLRISMGEKGTKSYKENFTLDIFEKRLVAILRSQL